MESCILYKLEKIKITLTASDELAKSTSIDYVKYRIQYTGKKDFDGHWDMKKKQNESFVHEIKGPYTTQERR